MPTRFGAEVGTLQSFVTTTAVKAQEIIQLYIEYYGWPVIDVATGEEVADQSDQAKLDWFVNRLLHEHVIPTARTQKIRNAEQAAREAEQSTIDQTDWSD